jgi:hypothetical protein
MVGSLEVDATVGTGEWDCGCESTKLSCIETDERFGGRVVRVGVWVWERWSLGWGCMR